MEYNAKKIGEVYKTGQILISRGKITAVQLDMAIGKQEEYKKENMRKGDFAYEKKKIGEFLIELGFITSGDLAEALSIQCGIKLLNKEELDDMKFDPDILKSVDEKFAKSNECIVARKLDNGKYFVISTDPTDTRSKIELSAKLNVGYNDFEYGIVSKEDFEAVYGRLYNYNESIKQLSEEVEKESKKKIITEDKDDNKIMELINSIITTAIRERASDIHIEPASDVINIRFRIDTMLIVRMQLPLFLKDRIRTKLLLMCELSIENLKKPLDGRFGMVYGGKQYDFRVNFLPTYQGDKESRKIAIRILNKDKFSSDITDIGFNERTFGEYKKIINEPFGLVLVVGPVGSGKSTTLYCTVRYKDPLKKEIITLEDPPEFFIPNVNQCKVGENYMNYEEGLAAIIRQDVDIIMLGEIRDRNVANLAIQAAEMGRLVLSTMHSNDAVSTLTKLISFNISPYFISAVLNGVVSQRLVRKVCPYCLEEYTPHPDDLKMAEDILKIDTAGIKFKRGRGCSKCNNTGYIGALGVFEILNFKSIPALRDAVYHDIRLENFIHLARENGFKPMIYDALEKVVNGYTTFDEVNRVIVDTNQKLYVK